MAQLPAPTYACSRCGRACKRRGLANCQGCRALFYCSTSCCRRHATEEHDATECARLAAQLNRGKDLELRIFPWFRPAPPAPSVLGQDAKPETSTSPACASTSLPPAPDPCHPHAPPSCPTLSQHPTPAPASLPAPSPASTPATPAPASPPASGLDWAQVYRLLDLPLSSPEALRLHAVATLVHALLLAAGVLEGHGLGGGESREGGAGLVGWVPLQGEQQGGQPQEIRRKRLRRQQGRQQGEGGVRQQEEEGGEQQGAEGGAMFSEEGWTASWSGWQQPLHVLYLGPESELGELGALAALHSMLPAACPGLLGAREATLRGVGNPDPNPREARGVGNPDSNPREAEGAGEGCSSDAPHWAQGAAGQPCLVLHMVGPAVPLAWHGHSCMVGPAGPVDPPLTLTRHTGEAPCVGHTSHTTCLTPHGGGGGAGGPGEGESAASAGLGAGRGKAEETGSGLGPPARVGAVAEGEVGSGLGLGAGGEGGVGVGLESSRCTSAFEAAAAAAAGAAAGAGATAAAQTQSQPSSSTRPGLTLPNPGHPPGPTAWQVLVVFWHGCLHEVEEEVADWVTARPPHASSSCPYHPRQQQQQQAPWGRASAHPHGPSPHCCLAAAPPAPELGRWEGKSGPGPGPNLSPGPPSDLHPGPGAGPGPGPPPSPSPSSAPLLPHCPRPLPPGPLPAPVFARGSLHRANCLALAPNAGLPVYPSWLPSLQRLALTGSPLLLLTDYCEEAMLRAQHLLSALVPALAPVLPLQLNPVRQPEMRSDHGNALPACSNAFLAGYASPTPDMEGFAAGGMHS